MNKKTLLDEFAMAAMAGGLIQQVYDEYDSENSWPEMPQVIALRAYDIAKAMIEEKTNLFILERHLERIERMENQK